MEGFGVVGGAGVLDLARWAAVSTDRALDFFLDGVVRSLGSGLMLDDADCVEASDLGRFGESTGSNLVPESAWALAVSFRARPEARRDESPPSSSMDCCTILMKSKA